MRIRSRVVETGAIPARALREGAVGRRHVSRWAAGPSGVLPGGVQAQHHGPASVRRIDLDLRAVEGPHIDFDAVGRPQVAPDAIGSDELAAIALAVDKWIRSSNYDPGVAGFAFDGNGDAELNNATVRGSVVIGSSLFSANYQPDVSGWAFDQNGNAELNDATIRGSVVIGSSLYSSNYQAGVSGWAFDENGVIEANDGVFRGDIIGAQITGGMLRTAGTGLRMEVTARTEEEGGSSVYVPLRILNGTERRFGIGHFPTAGRTSITSYQGPLQLNAETLLHSVAQNITWSAFDSINLVPDSAGPNDSGRVTVDGQIRARDRFFAGTSDSGSQNDGTSQRAVLSSGWVLAYRSLDRAGVFGRTGEGTLLDFRRGQAAVQEGSISISSSGVSYNTSSDYRLKRDVEDITPAEAWGRIVQVRPVEHGWIGRNAPRSIGALAHELADPYPWAVHGAKDEVDENGAPVYQGVDWAKTLPDVMVALQDLRERMTALENA